MFGTCRLLQSELIAVTVFFFRTNLIFHILRPFIPSAVMHNRNFRIKIVLLDFNLLVLRLIKIIVKLFQILCYFSPASRMFVTLGKGPVTFRYTTRKYFSYNQFSTLNSFRNFINFLYAKLQFQISLPSATTIYE